MRKVIILVALFISINAIAQDEKTVTITVTGQGKTIDAAKTNALRSAIEQAFGTFVSSNTTILNDSLVKDEIVSVTNGNIQKYDVLNETPLPDGSYATTLKAIVSVSKLTSFCESKGIKVEFKGGLFAMNIAMQELNVKSELIAWDNTYDIILKLLRDAVDYNIHAGNPKVDEGSNGKWKVPIIIDFKTNKNYQSAIDQILNFCKSVNLTENDAEELTKEGKPVYQFQIENKDGNKITVRLRSEYPVESIFSIPNNLLYFCIVETKISNGLKVRNLYSDSLSYEINGSPRYIDPESCFNHKSGDYPYLNFSLITNYHDGCSLFDGLVDLERGCNAPNPKFFFKRAKYDKDWNVLYDKDNNIVYEKLYDGDDYKLIKELFKTNYRIKFHVIRDMRAEELYRNLSLQPYTVSDFISIKFNDVISIDDLKKVTEYKIEKKLSKYE